MIKTRGYKWNTKEKIWYKEIFQKELEFEKNYLSETVYDGQFRGSFEEINPNEKYKT